MWAIADSEFSLLNGLIFGWLRQRLTYSIGFLLAMPDIVQTEV